jgi:prepilin-type N-terminal cleavage/methylation domain-containing protein
VKRERSGLTLIEILVVVGVIAILVGMLVPSLRMVKNAAREVKQKAQFTAIELGLAAFKNDHGEYPESKWWNPADGAAVPQDYCGAQKLAEALLGWDLMGFHPRSAWRSDGLDIGGGSGTYDPVPRARGDADNNGILDTLEERRGPYIEMDTANVFRLGCSPANVNDGLYPDTSGPAGLLAPMTHVLTDVFEVPERRVQIPIVDATGQVTLQTRVPGTPILYYRADPSRKTLNQWAAPEVNIYNARDNVPLISLGRLADARKPINVRRKHPVDSWVNGFEAFYRYVSDPQVSRPLDNWWWPYRPDSYLLISAGPDGLYGTEDDVRNFGRK